MAAFFTLPAAKGRFQGDQMGRSDAIWATSVSRFGPKWEVIGLTRDTFHFSTLNYWKRYWSCIKRHFWGGTLAKFGQLLAQNIRSHWQNLKLG